MVSCPGEWIPELELARPYECPSIQHEVLIDSFEKYMQLDDTEMSAGEFVQCKDLYTVRG